jgi:hypothetical protein
MMSVQELIDALQTVQDKSMPVVVYKTRSGVVKEPTCSGSWRLGRVDDEFDALEVGLVGSPFCPIYIT